MRNPLDEHFGPIALAFIAAAALAGGVIRHSPSAALVWALTAAGLIILFFILLGLWGAARERLDELRARAEAGGSPLVKEVAKAWAWGLVLWSPPQSLMTQYLMVWAVIGASVIALLPRLIRCGGPGRLGFLAVLVVSAGFINAAFHRGEP